jgi:uroporphyrinogen-III synthase
MSAGDLGGLRVAVTREAFAGEAFAARLRELGAAPVICPAIGIRFRNPPGFHDALLALERFGWVAFTSANAVRAVVERCAALGIDPVEALGRTRVAAVGRQTAEALRENGVEADLVPGGQSGSALAAAMIAEGVEGKLIFLPASRIARPELPNSLRAAGAGVVVFGVYETLAPDTLAVECREALERGEVDVLTFFSPSAARYFLSLAGETARQIPAVCIGETTAAAVRELGISELVVAPDTSADGVIAALLEFQRNVVSR